MQLRNITSFICPEHGWVEGRKCPICKKPPEPGESCKCTKVEKIGVTTLYDVYRPPRPKTMSPVAYYKKYGCVDDRYYYKCNGRYYCNPAHCSRSWKDKKKRDAHLDMAYGALG